MLPRRWYGRLPCHRWCHRCKMTSTHMTLSLEGTRSVFKNVYWAVGTLKYSLLVAWYRRLKTYWFTDMDSDIEPRLKKKQLKKTFWMEEAKTLFLVPQFGGLWSGYPAKHGGLLSNIINIHHFTESNNTDSKMIKVYQSVWMFLDGIDTACCNCRN